MIKLLDILSEIKINEPPSFDSKTVISQITQAFEEAENNDEPVDGQGMILDRNELLKQILAQTNAEKK